MRTLTRNFPSSVLVGIAAIWHPLEKAAAFDSNAPFASGELVLRHAGNDLCAIA
jgi:hypothetical protein